jgi:hypothetical protein
MNLSTGKAELNPSPEASATTATRTKMTRSYAASVVLKRLVLVDSEMEMQPSWNSNSFDA